jgi:hypothetical protein
VSAAAAGGNVNVASGNGGWQQPNTWRAHNNEPKAQQWNNEQAYKPPSAAGSNQWAHAKKRSGNSWHSAAAADKKDDEYESLSQPDKLSRWHSNHKGHMGKGKGRSKPSTRGNGHNKGEYQAKSAEKSKWDPSKVAKTTTSTEAQHILVYCKGVCKIPWPCGSNKVDQLHICLAPTCSDKILSSCQEPKMWCFKCDLKTYVGGMTCLNPECPLNVRQPQQ